MEKGFLTFFATAKELFTFDAMVNELLTSGRNLWRNPSPSRNSHTGKSGSRIKLNSDYHTIISMVNGLPCYHDPNHHHHHCWGSEGGGGGPHRGANQEAGLGQSGSDPHSPRKRETCQHSDEIQAQLYFLNNTSLSSFLAGVILVSILVAIGRFASPCGLVWVALVSLLIAFLRSSLDRLQPISLLFGAKSSTFPIREGSN